MTPLLHRQRGAVAIMTALAMLVLLAVVGLVIDGGLAYLVKARLNAAVDSAALAGARAVTTGNNQTEQTASAQGAAADFFNANMPTSFLLSSPKLLATKVSFDQGQATIDVSAEAPMPVSVMQVVGFSSLKPVAAAQTIRRDLDMAFVIDTSGSLQTQAATVRSSAKTFLNKFNVTQDRVSLIHFASGAEVDFPINQSARGFNRASMLKKIDAYVFADGTASVEGMWNARDQLNAIPTANRSTMRVIVFFSDGDPSALGSVVTFATAADCTVPGVIDKTVDDQSRTWVGYGMSDLDSSQFSYISDRCRTIRNNKVMTRSLPAWYNAHDNKREFPIVTDRPRRVTADLSTVDATKRNIELAARNLAEAVADKARDEGIVVFTLGMGAQLKKGGAYDTDTGEMILKCMANVPDAPSRCYNAAKPEGMYCYAATEADLTPCFSRLASAILRITK
ncbi:pilus assembly protein [Massilia sp. YIM B02443]|uniref:pilus assembly protein n=1 Tax=Massilia sp. YIM B02443 TaxID=3050127 RepID=UPI0025B63BDD|nr:pilus assembly protein [Massilia sp. YIM B02443]MDN4038176.1 pilus assembly protein [Massilia sp. YIM B02443]